ncbi:hypothetical protein [Methylobacterium sp. A54F]
MKIIRMTETVEHRFVFDPATPPVPVNDLARLRAYEVARAEISETDLVGAVWKVPAGAEIRVPDRCADKIVTLGYATLIEVDAALAAEA